ncbi:MAG: hypothetical protein LBU62_09455 [Bacteroidales bacterium]|jgi:hypothetical protein|nr:hypothetical protein [Bacteroidales bacterium]
MDIDRRKFISTAVKGSATVLAASSLPGFAYSQGTSAPSKYMPVSQLKKPVAIAMWDYSWILRHHRYGEFENWDKALEGLAERGYDAIRMDAMPQFVVSSKDGKITNEFRSIKDGWVPAMWGNDYTMSFRPREALIEFLTKCKKYNIRVGLASWFLQHGTERSDIFTEEGGLFRAWDETLTFLDNHHLLDNNILYVDVLNEYPTTNGYDWMKREMNYNQFANDILSRLKNKYKALDFFFSLDHRLADFDLTNYAALDYHIWFNHRGGIPGLSEVTQRDQSKIDYRVELKNLQAYWAANKSSLTEWMNSTMSAVSQAAAKQGIVCGNTEGWGPIFWYDHPELDWWWVKESAEVCIDLLKAYPNYKFICTSNFTHPQFKGLWEDVKWHKEMTRRIHAL